VWIKILGNGEAALWGWCGLGTCRGCGTALAKECGHQFFVVVFAHCGLVWFRRQANINIHTNKNMLMVLKNHVLKHMILVLSALSCILAFSLHV